MKIVFAGPSLYGADVDTSGIEFRGPAETGCMERAIADGATVIGLIDGHYQQVGAVWHKEILFALSSGVAVLGAASMGALRAAECEPFGMIPVGSIARRYSAGELFDDADVAITNGPAELGFPPLTEAMVDVVATIEHLTALGLIEGDEAAALMASARAIFFADRTIETICGRSGLARAANIRGLYAEHRVSQKTLDALELVEAVRTFDVRTSSRATDWQLAQSPFWTGRDSHSSAVTPL
jgi:hypothetical protein